MLISDWSSDVCSSDLFRPIGDGRLAVMTSFSFHPVKTIAMGEGGAVTTNDGRLAERLSRLRAHGMVRDEALLQNESLAFDVDGRANHWYYEMQDIGLHYRVTAIQCLIGRNHIKHTARSEPRPTAIAP